MRKDYISIPKSNSIPFVKIEELDNLITFENEENLFSFENQNKIPYCSNFIYLKSDKPSFQVKSNFLKNQLFLRKEDGTEKELFLSKVTDNLDRFESYDCKIYNHYSGKIGIYFEEGNTYNQSQEINGIFSLLGEIPESMKIGNEIYLEGFGNFNIESILIDEEKNKKIGIISGININEEQGVIYSCTYDVINFEVYEYYFNFEDFEEGFYDFYLKSTSSDDLINYFQSENIEIKSILDNSLSIYSYNEDNRDMFFSSGIRNNSRFIFSEIDKYIKDESEINIDDDNAQLIKSFINFGHTFKFENITEKELDVLVICLSSESIFINGIGYIKDGSPSFEKIQNTNIYKLEMNMLKTNVKLDLQKPRFNLIDFLIPNLIPDN